MDTRETLSLLRWLERAEIDLVEHGRRRETSQRAAGLEIVVTAQVIAVKHRLRAEQARKAS